MNSKRAKTPQPHQGPGVVRIISGRWKGRRLPVLTAEGLRPTTDRVKETLFNWLMTDIDGSRVLDCFSGSGSLALEALSRHAAFATLIELDAKAAKLLQQHLMTLACSNANVIAKNCLTVLSTPPSQPYDVVFIDPPFRQNLVLPCIQALDTQGWLANEALIYVECEKELDLSSIPSHWRLLKEKVAGQLSYRLYQAMSKPTPAETSTT